MLTLIARYIVVLLLLLPILVHAETTTHTKSWNIAVITGPLSADKRLKFYLQPQVNFIDDKYKFHAFQGFAGLGYVLDKYKSAWLLGGYIVNKTQHGHLNHLDVIREQFSWNMAEAGLEGVESLTRLEERKNLDESTWYFRLREQLSLKVPFPSWPGHALVIYDELFFSLNHPAWINSSTLVEQNRAFIGIRTILSAEANIDVGYLNQYQYKNSQNELSNVLQVKLNVNFL